MYNIHNVSTLYVSPTHGDDLSTGFTPVNDGFHAPFRTLQHAVDVVGEMRVIGDFRPITIVLTEDIYLEKPLEIRESGITIEGNGHKLTGGIRLTNWKMGTFNGVPCSVTQLPEKEGGWDFTDLWVNGNRADVTRYPKEGYLRVLDTENNPGAALYDYSKWFLADPAELNQVEGLADAIVNYYHFWIDEHSPIESYDPATGKLVMAYASRFRINTDPKSPAFIQYYLTNVPATFGAENEWYLERSTGRVYYAGRVKEAFAPTLPYLIRVAADNVRIRNLELLCTRGDYESCYKPKEEDIEGGDAYIYDPNLAFASDIQSVCWAPGAVIFEKSRNCSMESCRLHHIGIHGIEIRKSCHDIRIENNIIDDMGAGGIKIYGGSYEEAPALATTHCVIRGNEISHCGRRYAAGCGILGIHTSHLEISDNHIHHMDYTGISVGWVWGYAKSSTYANLIRRNHIHHIGMGRLSDMGGVYLLGNQAGTVVCENRIHDITSANYGGWGLYTDEGSGNITLENNVVYRTKDTGYHQHYGVGNVVRNNIFAFGGGSVQVSRNELHNPIVFENNIYLTDGKPIYHEHIGIQSMNCSRNLLWDISGPVQAADGVSLEEWQQKTGKDAGSIAADPHFVNAAEYDFTLCPDSPALSLGFRPIKGFPATGEK